MLKDIAFWIVLILASIFATWFCYLVSVMEKEPRK